MKKVWSIMLGVMFTLTAAFTLVGCGAGVDKEFVALDATDLIQEDFGIAVKKGDSATLNAVNAVIDEWLDNGKMEQYIVYYTQLDKSERGEGKAPSGEGLKLSWDVNGDGGTITVYTESGFAPFEWVSDNGKIIGVDIAIMSQVAENLGKKLVIEDIQFDTIPLSVKNDAGSAVGAAGMTITEDRKREVDFSNVYYNSTLVVVSAKENSISSLAGLAGKKVGVQEGTSGDLILEKAISSIGYVIENEPGESDDIVIKATGAEARQYKQYALAFADLKNGRIDAILMDKLPALAMLASLK